jgi:CubicO group peptidase (beta-lactamase class C family)
MPLGDGGLISTARDYGKFLRCLLQKSKPLISEATHQSMVTNQIGELVKQPQPAANKAWAHPFPKGAGVDKVGWVYRFTRHWIKV